MNKEKTKLQTDIYLPYMRDVARCEQSLRELNQMWRMIESSAKMNCPREAQTILPIMAATRAGFGRLEQELVDSLAGEKVANVLAAIGAKAHYVIDIMVRNLYERTADVGFLATDRELCAFVASAQQSTQGPDEDAIDAIRARLFAYRSKYTVYDEIMLLDLQGNVLVQLDPESPVEGSSDALIARTLESDTFVETFRASELRPGKAQALIYSRRMHHPDTGAVVGLLCLCFDFENEMRRIFRSHRDPEGRSNMLLLDGEARVIASADEHWIAPGTTVPVNLDGTPHLQIHQGREYLIRTFHAEGYQGYMGPQGWRGQLMIPVDLAFSGGTRSTLSSLAPAQAAGLLQHARNFSPPLHEIITATETIRRVVWNGQVITADQQDIFVDDGLPKRRRSDANGGEQKEKLKTILDQISETGSRSNALFSQSIRDLYETVLETKQQDGEFLSQLLVDLLDRNLYERADDCRWWALTAELRTALAQPVVAPEEARKLHDLLSYIHGLYTVYTQLFVYDRQGKVIARSRRAGDQAHAGDESVDAATLARVRALKDDQAYHVSAFEPTPFYGGKPTYIYHAAVRAPAPTGQNGAEVAGEVVGGIGIVFDAATEFEAMLRSGLAQRQGQGYFTSRAGRIIASTDPAHPVGERLDDPALLALLRELAKGKSISRIVEHDGHYAVLGCAAGQGYREFKVSDGYEEDVLSVVFQPLGAVQSHGRSQRADQTIEGSGYGGDGRQRKTYATFHCGGDLLALPALHVVEALPASALSARMGNGGPAMGSGSGSGNVTGSGAASRGKSGTNGTSGPKYQGRIGMLAPQGNDRIGHFVWVFDLSWVLHQRPGTLDDNSQIIIVRHGLHTAGLLVDGLHAVPEFGDEQLMPSPFGAEQKLMSHFIRANGGNLLIQLLDPAALLARVTSGATEPATNRTDAANIGTGKDLARAA
ncbi:chemotaxis protein CheW [Hylemonella gracilis]|uniref:CheW protein n=1 Tax=Hylemonella gracilis ATCC 19624 TaxID=887062 RepID=F3KTQ7_9BURK|nr:chemotaxis protein CheW [Hylemonella gracilis]EGI76936.1 CheW protein [Hylemonella gracilis ATCC 19624]